MTKPDKIDLTSTVIAQKESYPWHEKMILVPHEAIRRELLRAERAINVMDAVNNPWHAIIFEAWLSDFFFPAVHEHHYIEENVSKYVRHYHICVTSFRPLIDIGPVLCGTWRETTIWKRIYS